MRGDLETQGLAINLLAIADASHRRGYVILPDGQPATPDSLQQMFHLSPERCASMLKNLELSRFLRFSGDPRVIHIPAMLEETRERKTANNRLRKHRNGPDDETISKRSRNAHATLSKQQSQIRDSDLDSETDKQKDKDTPSPSYSPGNSAPPPRPDQPENAERERPPGFDPLIDNTRIKALCDAYPPSRGGRAYGVAARAVQVLADERYGGDCNAATTFLAGRVKAWAASAKGRELLARGFMPAFGNWLRDRCYDEADSDWAVVVVAASKPNESQFAQEDWGKILGEKK